MSTAEGAGQSEEGEYGRAAKRLKTEKRETEAEEREEGEEELEEGEDSDSGSLPSYGESAVDNRARWNASQYEVGRKVRRAKILSNVTLQYSITDDRVRTCVRAPPSVIAASFMLSVYHTTGYFMSGLSSQTRCWRQNVFYF